MAEARAKLDAIAKEMGYFYAAMIGTEVKPILAPDATRYRDPENKGPTWPAGDASSYGSCWPLMVARGLRIWQSHHAYQPIARIR